MPEPAAHTPLVVRLLRHRQWPLASLVLLTVVAVSIVNPAFLHPANLRDILVRCAPIAIIACGVTLVILTAEIDISVGSMMAILATLLGLGVSQAHWQLPLPAALLIVLAVGAAIGTINGLLVTLGRVPSIIVTLGMLIALRGVNTLLMGGEWITDLPDSLRQFAIGSVLGVPVPIITAAIVVLATSILLIATPLGRRLYAVGSDPRSARLIGLNTTAIRVFAFAITGLFTAIATIVSVPQQTLIEQGVGENLELLVVTCVVVGGVSIQGGRGSLTGVLLAVLLITLIRPSLIFLQAGDDAPYWDRAIQGGFILAAILFDHIAHRRSANRTLAPA